MQLKGIRQKDANGLGRLRVEEGLTAAPLLMMALQAFFATRVVNVIQKATVLICLTRLSTSCVRQPLGKEVAGCGLFVVVVSANLLL